MIGVLTHHWAKEDRFEEARRLLEGNGEAQSLAAGFVRRRTLYSQSDSTQITSLVIWQDEAVYDAWKASPEREVTMAGAEDLWSRHPESERFVAAEEVLPAGSR